MHKSKDMFNIGKSPSYLKFTTIKVKPILSILLFLAAIILIIGWIYPVVKVKSSIPKSPEPSILKAEDVFKNEKTALLINDQFIQQAILQATQNYESVATLGDLSSRISSQIQGKIVCVESTYGSITNSALAERFRSVEAQIQQAYAANWSYELRGSYQNLQQIVQLASDIKLETRYRSQGTGFKYVLGRASSVSLSRNGLLFEGEFYPVLSDSFLKKLSISLSSEDMVRLEQDKDNYNAIINAEIENWKQLKDEYKARLKEHRSVVRNRFYAKWYGVLMNLLLSFFMFRFLLYYFSLIQRKGLPKKSTQEVYFAINTSARIFRWLALFSVIVGIFALVINVLNLVFSSSMSSSLPFIGLSIGTFLYRALTPIIIAITTVTATWVIVLIAEHLCLISNLCHLSFLKVYGAEILEQQVVTPEDGDSPPEDE